ncbi:MAG: hypothetical protein WC960_01145 [Bacteroidales bacterium]
MAKKGRLYSTLLSPPLLGIIALALLITAFPLLNRDLFYSKTVWIPILSGVIEFDFLSPVISTLITFAITGVNCYIITTIDNNLLKNSPGRRVSVFLYLIILFTIPQTLFFSGATVATPLLLLSIYRSTLPPVRDKELAESALLLSIATLFEPLLLFFLPFALLYISLNKHATIKNTLLYITSFLFIPLLAIATRYLFFDDLKLFLTIYVERISSLSYRAIGLNSPISLLLLLLSLFLALKIALYAIFNLLKYKRVKEISIRYIVTLFLLLLGSIFLYQSYAPQLLYILAPPATLLLREYLLQSQKKRADGTNHLLLLILTVVIWRVALLIVKF